MRKEVTIVTALIDIGRGDINQDFKRGYNFYLEKFAEILKMPNYMVIYADSEAAKVVKSLRDESNTLLIEIEIQDLEQTFLYKNECDNIRQSAQWRNQAEWLSNSPQATLEWYNPLVLSKLSLLKNAAKKNPFKTTHFYWLDAGISNTVHPGYFYHDHVFNQSNLIENNFLFVCYPYFSNNEIHGFPRAEMNKIANLEFISFVARGGFFGGDIESIKMLENHYQTLLNQTLLNGNMGTEESIFTLLVHLFPNLCKPYFIEENGLLSTFFEALKNNNIDILSTAPNYKPINLNDLITDENWRQWHLESHIHFDRTINAIKEIIPLNSQLNYIDVGSSTGAFFSTLAKHFTIDKALLIEPNTQAIDFSKNNLNHTNIEFVNKACGDEKADKFIKIIKGENNNLGIFTVSDYAEIDTLALKQDTLNNILNEANFKEISLIKIHTPVGQLSILKGLLPFIQKTKYLPLIVFDYGYYESKDILNATLHLYYQYGYAPLNLYNAWGGDIILKPKNNTIFPNISIHQKSKVASVKATKFLTSTYIITYNFPAQFKMLMESFEQSGQYLLNHTNLIVLNNSDDTTTDDEYKALFSAYGIEEIKMGNLGICGGRQFVAEHFDSTLANQMVFFEDDMLLHKAEYGICRNGLPTWMPDIFEKSIEILNTQGFDFLKLSFSEFYGDHKTQWAWHNVPQAFREMYFKEHPSKTFDGKDVQPPFTNFTSIDTHQGLSFIKGEIYYSNWPHFIGKQGNKKMFLDTKWEHPYEQTWMSHFFQMTILGELKPALLLASPINHNRVFHYPAESRKENNPEIKF